ncbi:chemotaxis protein CheB [Aerolutibacter daejeonensis]|uniref:chemotaxis protein CheB n=1 Tax=Aerolutibacter daejeonensis TaxID=346181 RepID=UPI00069121AF|nr:chemotaxis protein CheB [Lysobacter daejeonensis]
MSSKAKRVALLSRPGAANDRLAEVLGDAGVELVLRADPTQVDVATVLGAQPDTLLVALDAPTEDALERLDAALHAPAVDVIYEEASLVVAREGWDAARWRRHLLAKLQGHGNVLPPAQGGDVHVPSQGPAAIAPTVSTPTPAAVAPAAPAPTPTAEQTPVQAATPSPAQIALPEPEAPFTTFSISQTFDVVAEPVLEALPGEPVVEPAVEPAHTTFASSMAWTLDPGPADVPAVTPAAPSVAPAGLEAYDLTLSLEDTPSTPVVEQAAADAGVAALDFSAFDPVAAEAFDTPPAPALAERWAEQAFVTEPEPTATSAEDRFSNDLASLELRIASMSLVDETPVRGPEKVRGAVLVMAGIGGPDAVRQLLGSLPADFVRPVLVQQRLDGARYDRLVAQMQRATTLPVKLAEVGQRVEQGGVYIVPDTVGVNGSGDGLVFEEGGNDVLAALPAADSAVLMLSGSDPARVDAALSFGWNGGLVVAQNSDGCYDAAAVTELAARGGAVAKPAEMGARLVAHWQRGG